MISGFLITLASFALVLGILVFAHEFGHFIVAKAFRIGVPVFSFGVGPRVAGVRRRGTDYRLSAFPLGGYVRLAGDETDEARAGGPEEFLSRPRWQRLLVYVAGAVFNVALALLVTWLTLWAYGKQEVPIPTEYREVAEVREGSPAAEAGIRRGDRVVSIAGRDARDPQVEFEEILMSPRTRKPVEIRRDGASLTVEMDTGADSRLHLGDPGWLLLAKYPWPPRIDVVMEGYPAEKAGLRAGDKVLAADGQEPIDEIHLRALLAASPGREVRLAVEREGKRLDVVVVPRDDGSRGVVGVVFGSGVRRALGPLEAAGESLRINLELSKTLFLTLRKVIRGDISVRAFSGPIEIARASRQAVKSLEYFLAFLAFISLQLGILNLLPIPVLDGGHILILFIEGALRRDLSEKLKERVMQVGMVLLLAFFAVVIYFDVIKTFF